MPTMGIMAIITWAALDLSIKKAYFLRVRCFHGIIPIIAEKLPSVYFWTLPDFESCKFGNEPVSKTKVLKKLQMSKTCLYNNPSMI
jgi:hypothetical protein